MSNALGRIAFPIDLPKEKLVELVGRPADDTDDWFREACELGEEWVKDHIPEALERYAGEPEVEVES